MRIEFTRRSEIKILPHKQSQNPLHLREIQEFYRLNKAEFYPLKRNQKSSRLSANLKFRLSTKLRV